MSKSRVSIYILMPLNFMSHGHSEVRFSTREHQTCYNMSSAWSVSLMEWKLYWLENGVASWI